MGMDSDSTEALREIETILRNEGYVGPASGEPVAMDFEIQGWCRAKNNESSIHVSIPNRSVILLRENTVPKELFSKICKGCDYEKCLGGRQIGQVVDRAEDLAGVVKKLIDIDRSFYEKSPSD